MVVSYLLELSSVQLFLTRLNDYIWLVCELSCPRKTSRILEHGIFAEKDNMVGLDAIKAQNLQCLLLIANCIWNR